MDGSAESPRLAAQRAAIQEARARYERGELSYEAFRRALDALVMARDADDCQAILRALPTSPLAPLAALEPSHASVPAAGELHHKWIVAFMSQIKKLRRPWRLQPSTDVVVFMGEAKLDLRLAEMPAEAKLRVTAIMGSALILVPPTAWVSVRTTVIMSDAHALGESISGMIAVGHDQHVPTTATATATATTHLDIEVFSLMGNVKVVLASGTRVEINELVRDALQAVAAGMQRGLRQGASQYPALGSGGADPYAGRQPDW